MRIQFNDGEWRHFELDAKAAQNVFKGISNQLFENRTKCEVALAERMRDHENRPVESLEELKAKKSHARNSRRRMRNNSWWLKQGMQK